MINNPYAAKLGYPSSTRVTLTPDQAERRIYQWCTGEARGSLSARTLAAVYASTYLDNARLWHLADLKVLDDERLEWALTLIRGYVEGRLHIPWARAIALASLYDLHLSVDEDG